tara:strand:- start:4530 stop:5078 length:549 start_codon:yes stop_codon:yes gene_type:complete
MFLCSIAISPVVSLVAMGPQPLPWLERVYEILDVDDVAIAGDPAFLEAHAARTELEILSLLFHRHLPPESIDDFGELVESKGGGGLYHRLLVLATVELDRERPWPADSDGPGSFTGARFLTRQRDYAKKGENDRDWFYSDGKLLSRAVGGSTVIEIEDVAAFVEALAERVLEDDDGAGDEDE